MLTVLMATRNGSRTLPGVLDAYTRLQAPEGGWKLVVVDNGSTDETREIVSSFATRVPVTYLFEEELGKNIALNRGLSLLEGDLAVFTDDDAFPNPDWLCALRRAADVHREYMMFGGVVRARFEHQPPCWIDWAPHGPCFAASDPKLSEGPTDFWSLFGPNMAIRAEVFQSGIRFDPSIGPRGRNYAMGSETELTRRLSGLGLKAWHVPNARVEHLVRDHQMRKSWVFKRAVRYGRGMFRLSVLPDLPKEIPCSFGAPRYLFRQLLNKGLKTLFTYCGLRGQKSFMARWEFNYLLGNIVEARIVSRGIEQASTRD
jgi:L-malate glycosyltransferase